MISFYGVPSLISKHYLAKGEPDFKYKEYGFYLDTSVIYNFKTHDVCYFKLANGRLIYDLDRASKHEALFIRDGEEFEKAFQVAYQNYITRKFEEDMLGVEKK